MYKRQGQGRENAKAFLRENPHFANEIEDKIRAAHGLDFDGAANKDDAPKKPGKEDDALLED